MKGCFRMKKRFRIKSFLVGLVLAISSITSVLVVNSAPLSNPEPNFENLLIDTPVPFHFPASRSIRSLDSNLEEIRTGEFFGNLTIDNPQLLEELVILNDIYVPYGYTLDAIIFVNSYFSDYIPYEDVNMDECESGKISRIICLNYVGNVRRRAGSFHYEHTFRESSFRNESNMIGNHSLTLEKTTSSGWSATATITQQSVAAAVGFNVSTNMTVSETLSWPLEARRTTIIQTWASASWTDFDTRNTCTTHVTGQRTGTGSAHRPVGIRQHIFTRAL